LSETNDSFNDQEGKFLNHKGDKRHIFGKTARRKSDFDGLTNFTGSSRVVKRKESSNRMRN